MFRAASPGRSLAGPNVTGVTNWVRAGAPVRVLDAGGWTDTWFAGHGTVCNLAVEPGIDVLVQKRGKAGSFDERTIELHLPSYGDRYRFGLDEALPGRHRLLESTLRRWTPLNCALEITVTSSVPSGSGMGTSASVVVALVLALQSLFGEKPNPTTLASAAHDIETIDLGGQSGVQDQIAAANGGANLIKIDPYPQTEVRSLEIAPSTWEALPRRMVTVYLGTSHHSSAVHEAVISRLAGSDVEMLLEPLRSAAVRAASALEARNIEDYGAAMISNTEAQAALQLGLVSNRALQVIEVAQRCGAVGWKVNGAGGEGGTVTIIGPEDAAQVIDAVRTLDRLTLLPVGPAPQGARLVGQG